MEPGPRSAAEHGPPVLSRRSFLAGVGGGAALAPARSTPDAEGPTERWRYDSRAVTAVVGHAGVYYLVDDGTVVAVDATSGAVGWRADAGGEVAEAAFAIDAETATAVALTAAGTAVGLALADGHERWRRDAGRAGAAVAVAGGTAYLLSAGALAAVDAASGETAWTHAVPDGVAPGDRRGLAVAATGDGPTPVYHTDTHLVGLRGGDERWRVAPETPAFSDRLFWANDDNIVAAGRHVYFQAEAGVHGVVDARSGELRWRRSDDYADLLDLRGGPELFRGGVVTSGERATVLAMPGGDPQWHTELTAYDCLLGTERALYVGGVAGGTATLRSFAPGGERNWTLGFGRAAYKDEYHPDYDFFSISPGATDGSIAVVVDPGWRETALRCYRLPRSEWLGEPRRGQKPPASDRRDDPPPLETAAVATVATALGLAGTAYGLRRADDD